jgi:hypothetical protein
MEVKDKIVCCQADPDEKRSHPADQGKVDETGRATVPVSVPPVMPLPVSPVEGRVRSGRVWSQEGSILDRCRYLLKKRV